MRIDRHEDIGTDAIEKKCRTPEPVEPLTNVVITWKTATCMMTESSKLLTDIATARLQLAAKVAFIATQVLQELNGRSAQIGFEHQRLKKVNGPETSMCKHVIKIPGTPLQRVEFGRKKTRIKRQLR